MQDAVLKPHAMRFGCSAVTNLVSGELIHPCELGAQWKARDGVWNANTAGKPIYVVGDSTAWHFSDAAIGAAAFSEGR